MKKVLVNAVCYNNFDTIVEFVNGFSGIDGAIEYHINIINNGRDIPDSILKELEDKSNVTLLSGHGNIGYFPGALVGLNNVSNIESYNCMIVCNMDLRVDEKFSSVLSACNTSGVIAPKIFSTHENRDRNPKVVNRYTRADIKKFKLMYSIPYAMMLYSKTIYGIRKNKTKSVDVKDNDIYAPHGSFIIFNENLHSWFDYLSYPVFLFGEEIHVGEVAIANKERVTYCKDIIVIDEDHGSTGLESEHFIRKNNLIAVEYLLKKYWS